MLKVSVLLLCHHLFPSWFIRSDHSAELTFIFISRLSSRWPHHFSSPSFPLPLHHYLTFPDTPGVSAWLVFLSVNRSIATANVSYSTFWHPFFPFMFVRFDLFSSLTHSVCSCHDLSTLYLFQPCLWPPPPSLFLSPIYASLRPSFSWSVRPLPTRSGSTCRRWGCSTSASLSTSSATARWCCRTWARVPHPPRARCSLALLTAWSVGVRTISDFTHNYSCIIYCCRWTSHCGEHQLSTVRTDFSKEPWNILRCTHSILHYLVKKINNLPHGTMMVTYCITQRSISRA